MADGEKNKKSFDLSEERFKYIGFDVFPGKAGDMFKSEEERKSWVEKVKAKLARSQGEVRDRCTLMEKRVSSIERIFLAVAAVVMVAALFIPWFSGYIPVSYTELGSVGDQSFFFASKDDEGGINDLAQALKAKHSRRFSGNVPETAPAAAAAAPTDSMAMVGEEGAGSEATPAGGGAETRRQVPAEINVIFVNTTEADRLHGVNDLRKHAVAYYKFNAQTGRENLVYGVNKVLPALPANLMRQAQINDSISLAVTDSLKQAAAQSIAAGDRVLVIDSIFYAGPALITDKVVPELALKGIINDNYSMTGFGALLSIGNYGSMVFSSGIVLVISGVLLIVYFLSCLVLAGLNLFVLFGSRAKTGGEQYMLYMKRMLRYNWIPVIIWLAMFIMSFVGASYGFDSTGMLKQIGDSYGIAAFIGLSSFGLYVTLGAFLVTALKGKEI